MMTVICIFGQRGGDYIKCGRGFGLAGSGRAGYGTRNCKGRHLKLLCFGVGTGAAQARRRAVRLAGRGGN